MSGNLDGIFISENDMRRTTLYDLMRPRVRNVGMKRFGDVGEVWAFLYSILLGIAQLDLVTAL